VAQRKFLPIRVVGVGSDSGADQIGLLAIHELEATGFTQRYPDNLVDIAVCGSPALLAAQCTPSRALIVLDAYSCHDPWGRVRHLAVDDIVSACPPSGSHGFDLKQALALCAALDTERLAVSVIGISIGPDASEAVEGNARELLDASFAALRNAIDRDIRKTLSCGSV